LNSEILEERVVKDCYASFRAISKRCHGARRILAAAALSTAMVVGAAADEPPKRPGVLFSAPLADAPGKELVVVELKFAPNPRPPSTAENHGRGHHHPGSVYVHVVEGHVRLGVEGEPVQVVAPGGSFFEAAGAHHTIAENASATEPARAIAVMIVPQGAPLVTLDEENRP
jgi:quercetin dioxygenase-like cupin family protein